MERRSFLARVVGAVGLGLLGKPTVEARPEPRISFRSNIGDKPEAKSRTPEEALARLQYDAMTGHFSATTAESTELKNLKYVMCGTHRVSRGDVR